MPMKVRYTVLDGEIISENRGGTISDYVPDSLGNTRFLLNSSQTPTDSWDYWPYGEADHVTGTNPTPMQFVGTRGCYQDSATRILMRARVQEPAKARFLTEDPIGFTNSIRNQYSYAADRPSVHVDPYGLMDVPAGAESSHCLSLAPGACYACLYPRLTTGSVQGETSACQLANATCGSHVRCGPGVVTPPSPEYGWIDCFANCIKAHDPLSNSQKIALTLAGGTVRKSWCKALGIIPRYSKRSNPHTTIPSIIHFKLGMGGRLPLRRFGRFWSPIWIAYGNYLGVVEAGCSIACLGNIHAY